jgi:hypothetical protein
MAPTRALRETLFLRRDFTPAERLEMGASLAQAHNRLAAIDDEEKSMKATIKEKKTGVELTIGSLSRKLNDGYEMENQICTLTYDEPNVGEVTYRNPAGVIVKTRAMTIDERQEQLPFDEAGNGPVVVVPAEQSAANIEEFFDKGPELSAEPVDDNPELTAIVAPDALPANFEAEVRQSLGAPEPLAGTLKEQLANAETMDATPSLDNLYKLAVDSLDRHKKIGATVLQRELSISYVHAARIIGKMKEDGLVDADGVKIAPKKKSSKEPTVNTKTDADPTSDGW